MTCSHSNKMTRTTSKHEDQIQNQHLESADDHNIASRLVWTHEHLDWSEDKGSNTFLLSQMWRRRQSDSSDTSGHFLSQNKNSYMRKFLLSSPRLTSEGAAQTEGAS